MNTLRSPFKFLDYYQQQDFDVFFGREQEAEALYHALSGVKLLLVYGPSGSGKTSLIECGLRNQFSDADWYALSIRRGKNMTAAVFSSINECLRAPLVLDLDTGVPADATAGFRESVERLFSERYQPVYLIFDQFEELLLLGSDAEKRDFFTRLQQLIGYKIPCRVLLVMREEFIGHLSEWEETCPSLFQHRFRLEKMGRSNVQSVLQRILEAAHYRPYFQVEQPDDLAAAMLSKLPDTRREIELAHVQVFLDELWHRAAAEAAADTLPVLKSTLVRDEDDLERILDSFLKNQLHELAPAHGDQLPLEVLSTLITERHTKLQAGQEDMEATLAKNGVTLPQPLTSLLHDLEQRRILRPLRAGGQLQYEISHDVLAKVVGGNLTEEMKWRTEAATTYRVYMNQEGLLSQPVINRLLFLKRYLAFPEGLKEKIRESQEVMEAERQRELEKARQDADQERQRAIEAVRLQKNAEAEKQKAQNMTRRAWGMAVLAVLGMIWAIISNEASKKAEIVAKNAEEKAVQSEKNAIFQAQEAHKSDSLAQLARDSAIGQKDRLEMALKAKNAAEQARLRAEHAKQQVEIIRLLNEADTYSRAKLFKNARATLNAVLQLDPDNTLAKEKLRQLQ